MKKQLKKIVSSGISLAHAVAILTIANVDVEFRYFWRRSCGFFFLTMDEAESRLQVQLPGVGVGLCGVFTA